MATVNLLNTKPEDYDEQDSMGGFVLGSNVIHRVTLLPKFVLYLEAG